MGRLHRAYFLPSLSHQGLFLFFQLRIQPVQRPTAVGFRQNGAKGMLLCHLTGKIDQLFQQLSLRSRENYHASGNLAWLIGAGVLLSRCQFRQRTAELLGLNGNQLKQRKAAQ